MIVALQLLPTSKHIMIVYIDILNYMEMVKYGFAKFFPWEYDSFL